MILEGLCSSDLGSGEQRIIHNIPRSTKSMGPGKGPEGPEMPAIQKRE